MLTLNQISYRWPGAATDCLCDISLQLKQGEWLALTGDNGAGEIDAVTSNGRSSYAHSRYGYAATTSDEKPEKPPARGKDWRTVSGSGKPAFHSTVADEIAFGLKLQNARQMKSLNVPMLPCNAVS